jgi:hypothetical protein
MGRVETRLRLGGQPSYFIVEVGSVDNVETYPLQATFWQAISSMF